MKNIIKLLSIALIFSLLLGGCGETGRNSMKETNFKLDESFYEMSDELGDFTLALNGKTIKLPLYYDDFVKSGWSLSKADKNKTLKARQYGVFEIELEGAKMGAYFVNFKDEEIDIKKTAVCGVVSEWDETAVVELSKSVKLGSSKKADIIKKFGKPTTQTSDEISYSFGEKAEIILTIKNGVVFKIDAKNIADPLYLNASEKVPRIVKDYKAPKELSTKLSDFTFYLYGKTYTMPLPVSVLIENGWILAAKTDDFILPGETYEGAVKLTTLNRTLTFDVKNLADYPTTAQNCFITAIESKYDMKLDMVLGVSWVRVGGSESSITSIFEKKDFSKIKKTSKKTEYIYEDPEKGRITITAKEGYISKIRVELI